MSKTAAERQKRYRDSKRNAPKMLEHQDSAQINGERNAPVTESVTRVTIEPARNARALPGDSDYVGVCKEVDGVCVVKPDPVDITTLTAIELQIRMKRYRGLDWPNSPEHKEVMHRLHIRTVAELESQGQFVPCWKYREAAA